MAGPAPQQKHYWRRGRPERLFASRATRTLILSKRYTTDVADGQSSPRFRDAAPAANDSNSF